MFFPFRSRSGDHDRDRAPVHRKIEHEALVRQPSDGRVLTCVFVYDTRSPYEVKLIIHTDDKPTTLVFTRNMLQNSFREIVGEGEVRLWTHNTRRNSQIVVGDGNYRILYELQRLYAVVFLRRSQILIPYGEEERYSTASVDDFVRTIQNQA